MEIRELLDGVRKQDLVLPEFQREYIWSKEQSKQLMISLLKNIKELPEKLGTIEVILDGQQRLTTLYLLTIGQIPPYYLDKDIHEDPRNLYFDISTGDFQYYQSTRMRNNPLWWRVMDCFDNGQINVFEIAANQSSEEKQTLDLAQQYMNNLNSLRQIREMELPVQVVPSHATITESIDIFDRVNSQGTKLTDAELALTHVTGKWPQARRKMKAKIDNLNSANYYFNLSFMTRALTGVVTNRALYDQIHPRSREELEIGWQRLSKILDYLIGVLPQNAKIHSTEDLNTSNVLVPLIVYLSVHDGHFPSEISINRSTHWLYAAHTWARYTAQTNQRLEHDVSTVVRNASPWSRLLEEIVDQRGRIDVKASDLEGRGVVHPLYRTVYMLSKQCGAMDWFNGAPLGTVHGKDYRLHSHHIFPQSLLYKNYYDADNHLHRKIVNEIANRAFLTATTNIQLSNTPPEEYLPKVEERFPGALKKQFVPMDPDLWRIEHYADFLDARRHIIARKFNEFMVALIAEPEVVHERPIQEIITLGESATLEFKSTLQWDVIEKRVNKHLRFSSLKTVAAFLNSEGGTLVIGVEDDGNVIGLENDLSTMQGSVDRFEQMLSEMIVYRIGPEFAGLVNIRFEHADGLVICAVDVDNAPLPAFMDGPKGKQFFIRVGNTTRALDPEETVSYIQMHWE
jgi:hypothetical protein